MSKHSGALARRYGTALFEILIEHMPDKLHFEQAVEHMSRIAQCSSKEILTLLGSILLSQEEREALLDEFLAAALGKEQLNPQIRSFLLVVLANHRVSDLKAILQFFIKKADDYLNVARVYVSSAKSLQASECAELQSLLQQALNKRVLLETEIDADLKSGFVLRVDDKCIDASLRSRLDYLKELFIS